MEKMNLHSPHLVNQNIERIAQLFPNCVTESAEGLKIDFDQLRQELSGDIVEGGKERYRLDWPGKREAIVTSNLPTTSTLRPVRDESVDFDTTENIYIEGDNLEVLKVLQESYLNKIKMIYIDPPYNTGRDFVYRDNFSREEEDWKSTEYRNEACERMVVNPDGAGRYHSDWLSMMYPRLKLARNLLTEDGVIFISIDDNEVHNLRKVCDEIFGEGNFVFQIAWRRTDNQSNIGNIAKVKEYIACYAKSGSNVSVGKLPLSEKAKNEYRYEDKKGLFRRDILFHKTRGRHYFEVKTKSGNILNGPWMIKKEDFQKLDAEDGIYWTSGGDEQPYGKIYLSESQGQIPNDFWGIEYGTNQRASLEVEALLEQRLFDFPKPISLLKYLLNIGSAKDSLILDFFSGSATTAHAVMQLNAEDGGNRKYILVQLPEETDEKSEAYKAGYKTIAEIGKERIRRAAAQIRAEQDANNGAKEDDLFSQQEAVAEQSNLDLGFRVYKLDSSNMKDVYYSPAGFNQEQLDIFADNIKDDRTDEDLVAQVMLDWGLPLSLKIEQKMIAGKKVYAVADDYLYCCFDDNLDEQFAREVATHKPLRIVFRDRGFANDTAKENVKQLLKQLTPETQMRVI